MAEDRGTFTLVDLAHERGEREGLTSKEAAIQVLERALQKLKEEPDEVDVLPLVLMTVDTTFHILNNQRHSPLILGGLLNAAVEVMNQRFARPDAEVFYD